MKSKLNLDEGTITKLSTLLTALKSASSNPSPEIASVLNKAGISWDKAIAARKKLEPADFFVSSKIITKSQLLDGILFAVTLI